MDQLSVVQKFKNAHLEKNESMAADSNSKRWRQGHDGSVTSMFSVVCADLYGSYVAHLPDLEAGVLIQE